MKEEGEKTCSLLFNTLWFVLGRNEYRIRREMIISGIARANKMCCQRCFSRRGSFATRSGATTTKAVVVSSSSFLSERQNTEQRYLMMMMMRNRGRRRTPRDGYCYYYYLNKNSNSRAAFTTTTKAAADDDESNDKSASSLMKKMSFRTKKPSQTGQIAKILAETVIRGGDVICLHGTVGAGKSLFARAFIRSALNEDLSLSVTSPTYLIQNTYEKDDESDTMKGVQKVHHLDLYRLPDEKSVMQLIDLEDTFSNTSVSVFEWPDRLGSLIEKAENRVDVFISASAEINSSEDDFENMFGAVHEAHLLALDYESEEIDNDDDEDDDEEEDDSNDDNHNPKTIRTIELNPVGASITERLKESLFSKKT